MEDIHKTLAQNIKYHLTRKGIKQKELANAMGVSPATISSWGKGTYSPKLSSLSKLSELLDTPLNVLLGIPPTDAADTYSKEEKLVMEAYRANPDLRRAVRILLGVSKHAEREEE